MDENVLISPGYREKETGFSASYDNILHVYVETIITIQVVLNSAMEFHTQLHKVLQKQTKSTN